MQDAAALQAQLCRLQAEREAADELLAQVVQQAQVLLAEKQVLQRQAAELAADKAQLEERLDFLQEALPGAEASCCRHGDGAGSAPPWALSSLHRLARGC